MARLIELSSPEVSRCAADTVVLVPLGAVEQHSDHLPVGTDALLVTGIAAAVEAAGERVLLAPTLWYGASGHHEGFAGTASVGTGPLVDSMVALVGGLRRSSGLNRFLLLNGHGGNQPALRVAVERLRTAVPAVVVWGFDYWDAMFSRLDAAGVPRPDEVGHADEVETSLLLVLRPDLVDLAVASPDDMRDGTPPWAHTTRGFADRTEHGGVGDPTAASPERGRVLLDAAVGGILDALELLRAEDATDVPR